MPENVHAVTSHISTLFPADLRAFVSTMQAITQVYIQSALSTAQLKTLLAQAQATPPDLTGYICEECFDAMAEVWVPDTDLEPAHGACKSCAKKGQS